MLGFDAIFGQDRAIDLIRRACLAERLPHGLIFAGPTGVGKGTTARALGGLFLCEKPAQAAACGQCASCKVFAAGNHPDFHLVYRQLIRLEKEEAKAKDLPIKVIRDFLVEPANRKSAMGQGKVFVVDEAESMNAAAQNAMLKTLEEPAGRTLIVLLTDQPELLLPTIRSRCQLVRFGALEDGVIRRELEKRRISPGDAADAALFAEGSLGKAIQWMEDGVVGHARELRQRLEEMLGGRPMVDVPEWFKKVADEYASKQLERDELASKDQMTREGLGLYLRLAAQMLRRHLSEAQQSEQLDAACSGIEALARADQYLEGNVNISLIFQQLAVTLERLFANKASHGHAGL